MIKIANRLNNASHIAEEYSDERSTKIYHLSEQNKASKLDEKLVGLTRTGHAKTLQWKSPMDSMILKASKESWFFIFLTEDFFDHLNGAKINFNFNLFHKIMRLPKSNLDF